MTVYNEEPNFSAKMAKQLLNNKNVYLTKEGRRLLEEILKKK